MKNARTVRLVFKLTYYRKSPKTTIFRYCGAVIVRIVRARKIADFYQIKQKKLTKVVNRKPKINQKKLGHYEGYELILPKIMKKH
jgi:hypothetical protein